MCAQANTGTLLDRILESRRAEVQLRKKVLPETALKYGVQAASPLRDFPGALTRPGINVMAELKPASPSRRTPRLGEAGLSSAITLIPGRVSAPGKSRSGDAACTPYFSAVSGSTFLRS